MKERAMQNLSNKPRILVLASPNQSRLAHFRKLYQLRDKFDFVGVCIGKGRGWESRFVQHWIELDDAVTDRSIKSLQDKVGGPIDGIINISEAYVPLHAALCERYEVLGPGPEVVAVGRNKYRMRQFCQALGLPVPRFQLLTTELVESSRDFHFPVVIKPAIGCSSTLVERIESYSELQAVYGDLRREAEKFYQKDLLTRQTVQEFGELPFVVEELMGGEVLYPSQFPYKVGEISVESVYDGMDSYVLAIHDSPIATNGPYFEKIMNSTPTRMPQQLITLSSEFIGRIHQALGAGAYVLHTEMRTFRDGLMIVEFGARIGGSSLYRSVLHSTGNDFIEILISLALGREVRLMDTPPIPTITHYLCAPAIGRVRSFRGETALQSFPHYLDHQLYDEIGDYVTRPPLNTRACGYVVAGGASFSVFCV